MQLVIRGAFQGNQKLKTRRERERRWRLQKSNVGLFSGMGQQVQSPKKTRRRNGYHRINHGESYDEYALERANGVCGEIPLLIEIKIGEWNQGLVRVRVRREIDEKSGTTSK